MSVNDTLDHMVCFSFETLDPFQMAIIMQGNIPGIFKFEKSEEDYSIDTTGYISIEHYLQHHTLTVKVFKTLLENFLSIMEDSLLYYLDWHNYDLDSDAIYISIDEQELKMIYHPIEKDEGDSCPIKQFLFTSLMPYAKFTRDEDWSFFLKGVTALNTIEHTYKSIDLLHDVFQLREKTAATYTTSSVEEPETESFELIKEKKKPWLSFFSQIAHKSKTISNQEHIDPVVEETTVLKKQKDGLKLIPDQKGCPTIPVNSKNIIIGRSIKAADVILPTSNIGKLHAEIVVQDGQAYVRDLNSLNGTYINQRKLAAYELNLISNDDEIIFSDVTYRVEA